MTSSVRTCPERQEAGQWRWLLGAISVNSFGTGAFLCVSGARRSKSQERLEPATLHIQPGLAEPPPARAESISLSGQELTREMQEG